MARVYTPNDSFQGSIRKLHNENVALQKQVDMLYCIIKQHPQLNEIYEQQLIINKLKGET